MKVEINVYVFAFCFCFISCEPCENEDCLTESEMEHERNKYLEDNNKPSNWRHYLTQIEKAVGEYRECVQTDCSCHEGVITEDLEIWQDGISKENFIETKRTTFGIHYQIINHTLYREKGCPTNVLNCHGIQHFLHAIIHELPDMEFLINTRDLPQSSKRKQPVPVFSFSKIINDHWDIRFPVWEFWSGGPATSPGVRLGKWHKQREIISKGAENWPWESKHEIGFFRGSRTTNKRDPLILLSRAEPDFIQAAYTKPRGTLGAEPAETVLLEDHCKYKYLFNMVGQAASFRFKYLFLCNSVVFHTDPDWLEFFYPAMKPWVHYIPVKEDVSDAIELVQFARENDEIVHEIANRGRQFIWDHLRMEDITCYWMKLLKTYAQLLTYDAKLDESLIKITKP